MRQYIWRQQQILDYLSRDDVTEATAPEIAAAIGASLGNAQNALWRMAQCYLIRAESKPAVNRAGKYVKLRTYKIIDLSYVPFLRPSGYQLIQELERARLCGDQNTYS